MPLSDATVRGAEAVAGEEAEVIPAGPEEATDITPEPDIGIGCDCWPWEECIDGTCLCEPECGGMECGSDGCGGLCGTCSYGKSCGLDGLCFGGTCDQLKESQFVFKVTGLAFGKGGHPGEAMDLDDDPDTCAPADDCEQGLNNQFWALINQLTAFVDTNSELNEIIENGELVLLLDAGNWNWDGVPFELNVYFGALDPDGGECDWQTENCGYLVNAESFKPGSCKGFISFSDAVVADGKLTAGKEGNVTFAVSLPFSGDELTVPLDGYLARLEADVIADEDEVWLENGLFGWALDLPKLLMELEKAMCDNDLDLPISCDMMKPLLQPYYGKVDIDTDGDGEADATSVGMKFQTIPGTITGVYENLLL